MSAARLEGREVTGKIAIGRSTPQWALKGLWIIIGSFVVQALARGRILEPSGHGWMAVPVWLLASLCIVFALLANREMPGAILMAIGIELNLFVVAVNGAMPVRIPAGSRGIPVAAGGFYVDGAHAVMPLAGDIFALPAWGGGSYMLSVGDLVLFTGVLVLLFDVTFPRFRDSKQE